MLLQLPSQLHAAAIIWRIANILYSFCLPLQYTRTLCLCPLHIYTVSPFPYICFYSYLASCMLLPLFGVLQIYCTLSAFPYNTHAHCVCAPYIYTLCPHSLTYGPTPISVVSLYPFLEGSRLCDR
ncbi:hypothetical protein AAZX31_06G209400 [Glycine max]